MMKALLSAAGLVGLAIVTVSPMAQAAQQQSTPAYAVPETATPAERTATYVAAPQAPAGAHYVWVEGYEKGGEWRGRWVLVR
jgi:hypothetical protein